MIIVKSLVLKFKLDIEHKICKRNKTTQAFNKFVFLYESKCDTFQLFIIKTKL